jgi:hypothetical protein
MVHKLLLYPNLHINWKFRYCSYTLRKCPNSGTDEAFYVFDSRDSKTSLVLATIVSSLTLDQTRHFYKHFVVTVRIEGITHDEMLEFVKERNGKEIYSLLEGR